MLPITNHPTSIPSTPALSLRPRTLGLCNNTIPTTSLQRTLMRPSDHLVRRTPGSMVGLRTPLIPELHPFLLHPFRIHTGSQPQQFSRARGSGFCAACAIRHFRGRTTENGIMKLTTPRILRFIDVRVATKNLAGVIHLSATWTMAVGIQSIASSHRLTVNELM
jgi:hypothetical protein